MLASLGAGLRQTTQTHQQSPTSHKTASRTLTSANWKPRLRQAAYLAIHANTQCAVQHARARSPALARACGSSLPSDAAGAPRIVLLACGSSPPSDAAGAPRIVLLARTTLVNFDTRTRESPLKERCSRSLPCDATQALRCAALATRRTRARHAAATSTLCARRTLCPIYR